MALPVSDHGKWATGMMKKLLDVSAIPANALYQAKNAAMRPNEPPALIAVGFGALAAVSFMYPIAKQRNARSSVRKSKKNATVDLRVQRRRTVVKTNHPYSRSVSVHTSSEDCIPKGIARKIDGTLKHRPPFREKKQSRNHPV